MSPTALLPLLAAALAQAAPLFLAMPCPPCNPPDDFFLCTARYVVHVLLINLTGHGC